MANTGVRRAQCPEWDCLLKFRVNDEMKAHLKWDHNRSEHEAQIMVQDLNGGAPDADDH